MKWSTNTSVTKIFSRHTNMLPKRYQILNISRPSAPIVKGFHVLLNYSYTNVKKTVYLKNIWMRHSSRADCEAGIEEFLKEVGRGRGIKDRGIVLNGLIWENGLWFLTVNYFFPKKLHRRRSRLGSKWASEDLPDFQVTWKFEGKDWSWNYKNYNRTFD